jgi:hypothetical protein
LFASPYNGFWLGNIGGNDVQGGVILGKDTLNVEGWLFGFCLKVRI